MPAAAVPGGILGEARRRSSRQLRASRCARLPRGHLDEVFAKHPRDPRAVPDHAGPRRTGAGCAPTIPRPRRHLWLIDEEFRQNPRNTTACSSTSCARRWRHARAAAHDLYFDAIRPQLIIPLCRCSVDTYCAVGSCDKYDSVNDPVNLYSLHRCRALIARSARIADELSQPCSRLLSARLTSVAAERSHSTDNHGH